MLTSLSSHEEDQEEPHHHHLSLHPQIINPRLGVGFLPKSNHARQLLINCAELMTHQYKSDQYSAAHRLLSYLSTATSPFGDSSDRLLHQFTNALSLKLHQYLFLSPTFLGPFASSRPPPPNPDALQSSYLSFNQITPFLRFSHLTANQAILEAVDGHQSIHILDFDTMHGVQWPPLMQAIAERSDPAGKPPSIRITGTGPDLLTLHRTGDRLKTFAESLGLRFQFHPLLIPADAGAGANTSAASTAVCSSVGTSTSTSTSTSTAAAHHVPSSFQIVPGETLAVNCVLFLHKLLQDYDGNAAELRSFLRAVRAMNPAVVTVAEKEGSHDSPGFLQRLTEALDYYSAVFELLEATLPPSSKERLLVEQVWFGREIADVVAGEERHQRFERWEQAMRSAGFSVVPSSPFALSQAKLLLRLHYPSEGYQVMAAKDSCFLGWQNRPLFSVSSWH